MADLNPLDADKWRKVIVDFDAKVAEFSRTVARIQSTPAPAGMEMQRAKLLNNAAPIRASINAAMASLTAVRDWLRSLQSALSKAVGGTWDWLREGWSKAAKAVGLGAIPLLAVGLTIGGLALITAAITSYLAEAKRYEAGFKPAQKLLGLDSGGLIWVAAIAGIIIAGPYIVRQIEKRSR